MIVLVHDRAFATGALDGQLSGAAGAIGLVHDVLPELIESDGTGSGDGAFDVGGFDFAASLEWRRLRVGRFKPERVGVQREQSRRLCRSIAELEAQLDSGHLRRRPD